MKRRTFLTTVAGVTTTALAGCIGSSLPQPASDYDVGMSHHSYLPEAVEVRVGETVVWGNSGSRGHTVTAYGGEIPEGAAYFASGGFEDEDAARDAWNANPSQPEGGLIAPGETFEHTFEMPGTYGYVCIPHEPQGMVGTVTVVEK
ncbi:cupredoxin domain-containing protein [Halomarina oriensis]|uniref:Halocyanin n=1 Tax=Halomarina oriensis TaxID=671145 RepID=A0A6B0GFT2_9EURY|nr:plastocyanin/azurin family copper-binding protein [Halomarina oriensis]MWG33370.1 halocyanin [Halomarina oriensis]